jgi:hypothetical protein
VRLDGLGKLKNPVASPGIEPATFLLVVFFFYLSGGTLGTAATTGLLYQPRMIGDGDCGEIGGMEIDTGNRSTRRKPAPAPACSIAPQPTTLPRGRVRLEDRDLLTRLHVCNVAEGGGGFGR